MTTTPYPYLVIYEAIETELRRFLLPTRYRRNGRRQSGAEMLNKRRFVEEIEAEDYLHREAWRVVNRQIEYAEANPGGALYDDLVAMMFAYHSFEGYLNFVGEKIAPDLWKEERRQFGDTGIAGKLGAICVRCEISIPEKGRRPYSTVTQLKKLRDSMAHPKTYKTSQKTEFLEGKTPPLFRRSYLARLVNHTKAIRARDDVKFIADRIHSAAVNRFPTSRLGNDAFEGMFGMGSSTTRLVEN